MEKNKDIAPIIQSNRQSPVLITLSAYSEMIKSTTNQSIESSSSSSLADMIESPKDAQINTANIYEIVKMTTEISSAATITEQLQIPPLNHNEFKQQSFSPKGSQSNRSNPSEPFGSMVKRRDQDFKGSRFYPRPSLQIQNEKSLLKREQEQIRNLKQSLELEFQELESQKSKLQQNRKQYEDYLSNQRAEILNQMHQVQRKRQSLLIRQKILDRNNLLSSRKNRQASKYKLELFCYKLTHALRLPQILKSIKYHFFFVLSSYKNTSQKSASKEMKTLLRAKSCDKLGNGLRQKTKQPLKGARSRSPNQHPNKRISPENVLRSSAKKIKLTKSIKNFKNTQSNIHIPDHRVTLDNQKPKVKKVRKH